MKGQRATYDRATEQIVLGRALTNEADRATVLNKPSSWDFAGQDHRLIFRAVALLHWDEGRPFEWTALIADLREDLPGAVDYLADLTTDLPKDIDLDGLLSRMVKLTSHREAGHTTNSLGSA